MFSPSNPNPTKSGNISRSKSHVTASQREKLLCQRPATIWLTGLSGAGKSTIAFGLEKKLMDIGRFCCVIDGDNVRHGLNRDLGFSHEDRSENIRRVSELAHFLNEAGAIAITSFISPYRDDRQLAKRIIGEDRFIEVFVDAPITVCEKRDIKGLYKKARAGLIQEFTGISAPYEPPEAPQIHLRTDVHSADEVISDVYKQLIKKGFLLMNMDCSIGL